VQIVRSRRYNFRCPNTCSTSRSKGTTRQKVHLSADSWEEYFAYVLAQLANSRQVVSFVFHQCLEPRDRVRPAWPNQPSGPYLGDFFSAFLGFMLICRSAAASDSQRHSSIERDHGLVV
jgi:hypothetical protein